MVALNNHKNPFRATLSNTDYRGLAKNLGMTDSEVLLIEAAADEDKPSTYELRQKIKEALEL